MGADSSKQVTQLLANWSEGDQAAREALIPLVYNELRRLAASYLRRERSDHTLQPTLAAKAKCTLNVTFTPAATGTIKGVVILGYAGGSFSPVEIKLTGAGQ